MAYGLKIPKLVFGLQDWCNHKVNPGGLGKWQTKSYSPILAWYETLIGGTDAENAFSVPTVPI